MYALLLLCKFFFIVMASVYPISDLFLTVESIGLMDTIKREKDIQRKI